MQTLPNSVSKAVSIEDLRLIAKRRLPTCIFDFYDGGAEDEITLLSNIQSFREINLLPRILRSVHQIDTARHLLDAEIKVPFAVAPTGALGFGRHGADLSLAKAAADLGTIYTLSSSATTSIEQIARHAQGGRHWFQAYILKNKDFFYKLIDRAYAADYEGLMITVDLPVGGKRERDNKNSFSIPFKLSPSVALDFMSKPAYLSSLLSKGMPVLENMVGLEGEKRSVNHIASSVGRNYDASFNWDDLKRVRDYWHRKLIVKGVLHPSDAIRLTELGVDAVVVSNHGGRQLDTAVSTLDALPGVVKAVNKRIPVLMDGGIRRGSDIFKAIALGADAVLTGRATLFGAISGGDSGALHAMNILKEELIRTMQLSGVTELAEITQDFLFIKQGYV
jgi:(S)-mandelate dehydrogenase